VSIEIIIYNLVTKLSNLESGVYKLEMAFGDDFGIDSLDMVELIMTCEREFAIVIHDHELSLRQTPADLIQLVKGKISEKNLA